jgi:N6-adenosine-specific RNA methylase IME4
MLTWHKVNSKGMGYWFRGTTEHLLLGTRGRLKAFRSLHRNIIATHVGKHSEKPEAFADLIDEVIAGPKLELFARRSRVGWAVWGDEVNDVSELRRPTSTTIIGDA